MEMRYYLNRLGYMVTSRGRLQHRDVWEAENGSIPTGHHIHHINGNKADNRLENLQCLSAEAHLRLHGRQPGMIAHLARLRDEVPVVHIHCALCGRAAAIKAYRAKYCSTKCAKKDHENKATAHRAANRAAVRSSEPCPVCHAKFLRTRKDQICCSPRCLRRRHYLLKEKGVEHV